MCHTSFSSVGNISYLTFLLGTSEIIETCLRCLDLLCCVQYSHILRTYLYCNQKCVTSIRKHTCVSCSIAGSNATRDPAVFQKWLCLLSWATLYWNDQSYVFYRLYVFDLEWVNLCVFWTYMLSHYYYGFELSNHEKYATTTVSASPPEILETKDETPSARFFSSSDCKVKMISIDD